MKKSISLAALLLTVSTSLYTPLTAVAAPNTNLARIEQEIREAAVACLIDENGNQEFLDVTVELTQTSLPAKYKENIAYKNISAYSAKVKTTTGKYTQYGVEASSSLTLTWIDGEGADNSITNLTGYCSVAKGTFDSARIYWGTKFSTPTSAPGKLDVEAEFNEDIDYTSEDSVSGKLKAMSNSYIIAPKDGKTKTLSLQINPSIFD